MDAVAPSDTEVRAPGLRDWAVRTVQWDPARAALKYAVLHYARVRGRRLATSGDVPTPANIYAASSPKAGSQWMKALLDHPLVREQTGLFTLPQFDFQKRPERGVPLGTFVPGFYVSHDEYRRFPHRHPHRLIYMFRDPRDLVISGYFSAIGTHRRTNRRTERFRAHLREVPFEQGLVELIHDGAPRLQDMATWVGVEDENVATFRLEDVSADPRTHVARILDHCGVDLGPEQFEQVLNDVSRDSLQARDLAVRKDPSESHYRIDQRGFRELFGPEHYEAIETVVPGLTAKLGYPS